MKNLNQTAEELFAKIRGRFPGVTIGDEAGNVTQEPSAARFFEFPFREGAEEAGKISITLSEDDGVVVMYNQDIAENDVFKSKWYDFLKELRQFAKKRMLNFETRDITKSNLQRRDYQYLANRSEESSMNESKMYGTSRVSYQNVDGARLVIKHTESINQEAATGRTQKIGKIYIESADGERFMYPYKHLTGARAMARHVAEGGKPYDDFGSHIVGLSEELAKLRKFKTYMGRSAVMAESLSEYMDVVKERIATVKKTVESLQKPSFYKEAFEGFEKPVFEDVPDDIKENWIDQLTIKQFNEELADVFPYIYNLVSEATKAKELGPEDLVDEGERHGNDKMYDKCWDGYKKVPGKKRGEKGSCVKEEDEFEAAMEAAMGQFSEAEESEYDSHDIMSEDPPIGVDFDMDNLSKVDWSKHSPEEIKRFYSTVDNLDFEDSQDINGSGYSGEYRKAVKWLDDNVMNKLKDQDVDEGNRDEFDELISTANEMADEAGFIGDINYGETAQAREMFEAGDIKGAAKFLVKSITGIKNNEDAKAIYQHLVDGMKATSSGEKEGNAYAHAVRKAKMDGKKKGDKVKGPDGDEITLEKEEKTPLGEFILSYYDRETGEFPKGETAVLTMVEKDYGEEFIEPAKAFIERVNQTFVEYKQAESQTSPEFDRMRELAGLR